jgi:hypothetical protein
VDQESDDTSRSFFAETRAEPLSAGPFEPKLDVSVKFFGSLDAMGMGNPMLNRDEKADVAHR